MCQNPSIEKLIYIKEKTMKRIQFFIPLLIALFIAAIFIAPAQAQTAPTEEPVCRDAAGGVIPCTPTPQPETPTPVPTSVPATPTSAPPRATATATATPTEETGLASAEWSGKCKDTTCISQFTNGCEHVGGKVEIGKIEGGEVPLTCKVPMSEYEPDIVLAASPTEEPGTGKSEWSGVCKDATCIAQFTNGCEHVGGKVEIGKIENGEVPLTCTVPNTIDPGARFAALDDSRPNEDDYLGSCTNKNLAECREAFTCKDGLLVIEVDLYASGGTRYDFYCIPHDGVSELPFAIPPSGGENDNWTGSCSGPFMDQCIDTLSAMCDEEGGDLSVWYDDGGTGAGLYCENMSEARQPAPTEAAALAAVPQEPSEPQPTPAPTFPPSGWLPWATGFFGFLIGLLLPAVQKLMNKPSGPQEAFDPFLKLDGIPGESKDAQPAGEQPEIKSKKGDGGTEVAAGRLDFGDIKGESSQSASPAPQTREHILLANQDADATKNAASTSTTHATIIPKKGK
jgi:hypothetical protein